MYFAKLLLILALISCSSSEKKTPKKKDYPKMNANNVRYIISSNIQNFKSCYDRKGENKRQFVTLEFLVDRKGNVREPVISSNTGLKKLEECLETILLNLSFERSRKGIHRRKAKQTLTFVPAFEPNL